MQNQKMPKDPDLIAADAALRRAALTAKKLAEQQGVPYVINKPIANDVPQNLNQKSK